MLKKIASIVLCGSLTMSLQGCVEMAIGGAVIGTMAATDRRTLGAQTEDKAIMLKGESRVAELVGQAGHVNLTSFNRRVLLTGEVKDDAMKTAVEQAVASIEGVQSVINELALLGVSSYTSRSDDALITAKVKASLVDANDISANSFKVITERGTVYLMGRVTQREGTRASEVARGVSGAQKIVKVFEYLTDDDLKHMSSSK